MSEPAPEPASDPAPEPASDPAPEPVGEAPPLDNKALTAELAKTRKEAAKYRTDRNKERDRVQELEEKVAKLTKAITGDDEPVDADELAKQLADTTARYRTERVRNAYLTAASKEGADADLTWHVLVGSGALSDIDIDSDDFEAQVAEKVKAAVEANPKLKAGPVGPGDGDQGPRGGGSKQLTREDLKDMTPEDIDKARLDGRLTALMSGTT